MVGFRMSPEESEELDNRVKLSGYQSKQDYLIQSVLYQKIVAVGNPLMMVQFRKNLQHIENELSRISKISETDEELFTPIRTMLEILQAFENTATDNREELTRLMLERRDVLHRYPTAEEKLQNLKKTMDRAHEACLEERK